MHVLPSDRELGPVYDARGQVVPGRSSIADGYLRQIEQRLFDCQHRLQRAERPLALPASLPPEMFKCTVRGTVYAMQGKIDAPVRTDGCQMIRHSVDANGLTLTAHGKWVFLVFPLSGGHLDFAYIWGSPVALIAGKEVPIIWGDTN